MLFVCECSAHVFGVFLGPKHRTCSVLLILSAALIRLKLASTNDESKLFYSRYTMSLYVIVDNEEGAIDVLPENFLSRGFTASAVAVSLKPCKSHITVILYC